MRLLIFGATGATGRHLLTTALRSGHSVSAFIRDRLRLQIRHARLLPVVGDAMYYPAVDDVMPGHDAVLCALGGMPDSPADRWRRQPGVPVCSVATANIVAAMSRYDIQRIVVETSASVGSSRHTGRFGSGHIVRFALRDVMIDKERQEDYLRRSQLEWTIIRPVRLTEGAATGRLRSGELLPWHIGSTASRADVAEFMVQSLTDTGTVRRAITVSD